MTAGGFAIEQVWSGGIARDGSGSSLHHKKRAFDLDALIFADDRKWVADTFPDRPFIYLAIEACLRKFFGTVLNYDYNAAHQDHFHFDNGQSVGFAPRARSHALFVQHALVKLFDEDIGHAGADGVFGGDSKAALKRALTQLGIGGIGNNQNWQTFLDECATEAMNRETGIVFAPQIVLPG